MSSKLIYVDTKANIEFINFKNTIRKGVRVVVNIGTTKDPVFYLGEVESTLSKVGTATKEAHIRFDDGDEGDFKITTSLCGIIGIAKNGRMRVKKFGKKLLKQYLDTPLEFHTFS